MKKTYRLTKARSSGLGGRKQFGVSSFPLKIKLSRYKERAVFLVSIRVNLHAYACTLSIHNFNKYSMYTAVRQKVNTLSNTS